MTLEKKLSFTFSFNERLHNKKDFDKVFSLGRRLVHPAISIYRYSRDKGPEFSRMGLCTSGKIGIAVKRNRVKRLLREIFRLNKNSLVQKTDFVFVPRKEAINLGFHELEKIVLLLLKKGCAIKQNGK